MKNLKQLWCVTLVFLLSACADEDWGNKNGTQVQEGIPVKVTLKYHATDAQSRVAQTEETENHVLRVCAIAFDRDGQVCGRNFEEVGTEEKITLDMTSGNEQKIFLIGNYNSGVGTLGQEELENVKTETEFRNLSSSLLEGNETQIERMSFLMLGQLKNNNGGEEITVDEEGHITNCGNATIQLERVDARISFNIFAENGSYENFSFQPRYYRVERIPQGTYLVPRNEDYKGGYASMSEKSETENFDGIREINGKTAQYFEFYLLENRQGYVKQITEDERNKNTEGYNNSGVQNLYSLREKRAQVSIDGDEESKEGQKYKLGDWVYANPNSTYVTIRGTLSYQDGNEFVNADVTYTVHLGSTGNSTTANWMNDVNLVNQYATERNTHYTYNVTITGVNSIKVEVNDETEQRPGMEGDVIVAGGKVEDMDAHYGRTLFTLKRSAIREGLSWAFSTPLQRGMKVFDKEEQDSGEEELLQTHLNMNDYKWIKFAINREYPSKEARADFYSTEKMVKFPGEQAYDGGSGKDKPAPAYGGGGIESDYYGNRTVKLYDVNQLLNKLYKEANDGQSKLFMNGKNVSEDPKDEDATVTITAFVDEYIYVYDPTQYYYRPAAAVGGSESGTDLTLWKKTVNGDNRMLHICEQGAKYSPDGNSSWANSVISFSQRPVYTFYNPNNPEVKTAWGVESKGETGEIPVKGATLGAMYGNTFDNGRRNTLNILHSGKTLRWDEVLSVQDEGKLLGSYNNIWYACLLRNRDLNGDNIVNSDEIRWYLASIDQLTDIWIGEAAIPMAKLYTKTATSTNVPLEHVASSTYFDAGDNSSENEPPSDKPWVIWAEESASRGGFNTSGDDEYGNLKRSYRCVRNLGLSLNDIDEAPADYVIPGEDNYQVGFITYKEKTIDVSRMNSNAIRASSADNILPWPLTERDVSNNNRPSRKFAVIESQNTNKGLYPTSGGIRWSDACGNERVGYPCPQGYRMPNQRELMLMYTTYPDLFTTHDEAYAGNYHYLCKTGFSFKQWGSYAGNNRLGFVYSVAANGVYGTMCLMNSDFTGKVRCVRDVIGE